MEIHRELLKVFRKMVLDSKCTRKKKFNFYKEKREKVKELLKCFINFRALLNKINKNLMIF